MNNLRHTTSHVMAQAVKKLWPDAKLAIGPAIENGFYYDFDVEHRFTDEDLTLIEKEMKKIIKENLKLEREVISREAAFDLFKDEPYKMELIAAIPEGEDISTYRQGDFVDLCAGPHVESTGKIKAFKLLNIAGAYWRGDEHNKMLQRIYGTAFETKQDLDAYLKMREEAAANDHRKLGRELDIFSLHEEAPGMPFFHPNGMIIMNELMTYWREMHRKYGYQEIRTPVMLKRKLWETSGHWDHYAQGMYTLKVDDEPYAIKPMNCPGGILAESSLKLPNAHSFAAIRKISTKITRLAEVGLVHRAERSGQLHGLMRVREFTQDDAHIFCTAEQIEEEVLAVLKLMFEIYSVLGLRYELELSTRPADSIGSNEIWEAAEAALRAALEAAGLKYKVNAGEGAFYGPKIDVHLRDSIGRSWQCGTVQLDFNLPMRFKTSRPVMIHRVIYGSIERFIGMLLEHFKGALPLWLSPEQVRLLPLRSDSADIVDTVEDLASRLDMAGIRVGIDSRNETINKRIKVAALSHVPYTVVIGQAEVEGGQLTVKRFRSNNLTVPAEFFIRYLKGKINAKSLTY